MRTTRSAVLSGLAGLALALPAAAQPALIALGMGAGDVNPDGSIVAGSIYDAAQNKGIVYKFTRGQGAVSTGAEMVNGSTHISGNGSVIAYNGYNLEGLGGYEPTRTLGRFWTAGAGDLSMGLHPGANRCDFTINNANDISVDGRYVAGDGWTESLCGKIRAWVYDTQTLSFTQLPFSLSPPPINAISLGTAAFSISGDGTIAVGYDKNYNPAYTQVVSRAVVWTRSGATWAQTVLDPSGGSAWAVNTAGTVIVGKLSSQTMQQVFGTSVTTPIKWTRQGNAWVPQNLGGTADMVPFGVSNDGNTVIGSSGGGPGAFIWKPTINGGVPIELADYAASLGGFPGFEFGNPFGSYVRALSDDGDNLTVYGVDTRNPCLSTFMTALLDLSGASCEPARINFNPVSQVQPTLPSFGVILNTFASGSWPLNYQWQKETSPGVWTDLADDNCGTFDPTQFSFRGTTTSQLRLGTFGGSYEGTYRCRVSNACGNVISAPATILVSAPTCYANCDGSSVAPILNVTDFICFTNKYAAGDSYANCDNSTVPPILNVADFICFTNKYAAGCP